MERDLTKVIDDVCRCQMDGCRDCKYLGREDGGRCFEIVLTEALEAANRERRDE